MAPYRESEDCATINDFSDLRQQAPRNHIQYYIISIYKNQTLVLIFFVFLYMLNLAVPEKNPGISLTMWLIHYII